MSSEMSAKTQLMYEQVEGKESVLQLSGNN